MTATASLLLAGCMSSVQAPRDTLAELNLSNPAFKDLTLAVMYSQNTKEGLNFRQSGIAAQPGFVPDVWFNEMISDLGKRFQRTITVDSIADAKASNADLVAVVDDLAAFNRVSAKLDVKMSAIFTTPDQQAIDVVTGQNDPRVMWTHGAMTDSAREAGRRFTQALFASAKLSDFARAAAARRPGGVALPAAAAPVAASDVDELPEARPRRRGHAVIIGVENYREKLPKADFAAADARLAAEYAKRVLGYADQEVALLVDERATRGDFEKYFERWLPNRVEKDDEVFVYFSGHGAPNPKTGDAFLVPYEGDPTYIDQTGYPIKKLYSQLAKLPAKRIILAMDSCFSGAGGRSVIAQGARPLVTVRSGSVPAGLTVIAASAGDEISNSYQARGHGLFTYFLLKGLKRSGPDFRAAYEYLKPEVSAVARRDFNADQTPQWQEGR